MSFNIDGYTQSTKTRLVVWIASCLVISIAAFGDLWTMLPEWLSSAGLQRYGVFHWGVLGLCGVWLLLKRKDIIAQMSRARTSFFYIIGGAILVGLSVLLPGHENFLVFLMLLGWLGVFSILFGRACTIPSILLAVYLFGVAFPMLAIAWFGEPAALAVSTTVAATGKILGIEIARQEAILQFNSLDGSPVSVFVSTGCAGFATIGAFIALFALIMLDVRLSLKKTLSLFIFGLAGTWLQNILRIIISIGAGYLWGTGTLASVHYNLAYVIFPLWFALFTFVYLKTAGYKWSRKGSQQQFNNETWAEKLSQG
jgi:exosortase/archaeosortase family protein